MTPTPNEALQEKLCEYECDCFSCTEPFPADTFPNIGKVLEHVDKQIGRAARALGGDTSPEKEELLIELNQEVESKEISHEIEKTINSQKEPSYIDSVLKEFREKFYSKDHGSLVLLEDEVCDLEQFLREKLQLIKELTENQSFKPFYEDGRRVRTQEIVDDLRKVLEKYDNG